MNGNTVRLSVVSGLALLVAAPASAQRVRFGFDARLSDRVAASVAVDSWYGPRVAVRYRSHGPRYAAPRPYRRDRVRARHDREVRRLIREHDRLHRRLARMHPRQAARAHRRWHEKAWRQHGHAHPQWEHGRREGRRGNLRPLGRR